MVIGTNLEMQCKLFTKKNANQWGKGVVKYSRLISVIDLVRGRGSKVIKMLLLNYQKYKQYMWILLHKSTDDPFKLRNVKQVSKIIFSEKSLSVHILCVPSPQKSHRNWNFAKQSCQTYFKSDKEIFLVTLRC